MAEANKDRSIPLVRLVISSAVMLRFFDYYAHSQNNWKRGKTKDGKKRIFARENFVILSYSHELVNHYDWTCLVLYLPYPQKLPD